MGDIARQRTSCTLTPLSALLCVAALVLLFSLIGIFTRPPNLLAAFWPANAVLLGCMVRYPRLATPAGWAGGILGFFLAALFTGEPLFKTILLTCGNLAGIGVGYLLMHRLAPADKLLRRPTSLVLLLRNTLAASLAAGVVGAIINPILSLGPPLYGLGFWFASELVNYMTILPVLLTLPPHDSVPPWRTLLYRTEFSWTGLMPLLSLVASLLLTLLIEGPGSIAFPVPALLWCAVTYSVFATSLLTLGYSTLILIALSNGHLVINHDVQTQYWMFSVRIGVMLIALTPLTAASIMAARNSLLREMKHLAHHDHLTGALNRAGFWSAANELLQHLTVQRYPVAICMLDIDHFKRINDRHGHEEGDNQLSGFAARVRDQLRPGTSSVAWGERNSWPSCPASARSRPWRWPSCCEKSSRSQGKKMEPSPPSASRSASVSPPRERAPSIWTSCSLAPIRRSIWPSTMAATGWNATRLSRLPPASGNLAAPEWRGSCRHHPASAGCGAGR